MPLFNPKLYLLSPSLLLPENDPVKRSRESSPYPAYVLFLESFDKKFFKFLNDNCSQACLSPYLTKMNPGYILNTEVDCKFGQK